MLRERPFVKCASADRRPSSIGMLWLAALAVTSTPASVMGQRVLLFEDFEFAIAGPPDAASCLADGQHLEVSDPCIGTNSIDTLNRSRTIPLDPAFDTVTGGTIADPFPTSHPNFAPNNHSLVLHNPNSASQMAANVFSVFPDDANHPNYFLKKGVVEFDAYFGPLQPDGLWSFLGIRLGFELNPVDRNQVLTTGDEVVWHKVRMQAGGRSEEEGVFDAPEDKIQDGILDGQFYIDPNVIDQEIPIHFRYDLHGDGTYDFSLDNLNDAAPPVVFVQNQQWKSFFNFVTFQEEPAPGINEISFMTDASARSIPGVLTAPDVFLDNLRIVDDLRAPHGPGEREDLAFAGTLSGNAATFANVANVLEAWEAKAENDGSWYEVVLGPGQNGIQVEVTSGALLEVGMPSPRWFHDDNRSFVIDPAAAATQIDADGRMAFDDPIGPGNATSMFTIGDIGGSGQRTFPIYLAGNGSSFRIAPLGGGGPAADFDSDGDVDSGDFAAWSGGFPQTSGAARAQGDADRNGTVDGGDFLAWQRAFGTNAGAAAGATGVPEPAAHWLVLAIGLSLARRGVGWKSRP